MGTNKKYEKIQGALAGIVLLSLFELLLIGVLWILYPVSDDLVYRVLIVGTMIFLAVTIILQWYSLFLRSRELDREEEELAAALDLDISSVKAEAQDNQHKEENKMLVVNIDHIPGKNLEALGMAKGTIVYSKNFGKDFMAGVKGLVGGELSGYTEMLNEARQMAVKRMVDEAAAMGADAVVNVRYGSASMMAGAAEVIAYGTAVKYI